MTPLPLTSVIGSPAAAVRRAAGWVLALCVALLLCAGPAAAHNELVSAEPADGAVLTTSPTVVTLTFDQPVQDGFNTITVTGPGNTQWPSGETTTSGTAVSTRIGPLGPAGEYVIGYRVLSADGHPVTGSLRFTMAAASTSAPAAETVTTSPATTSPATDDQADDQASDDQAGSATDGDPGLPAWLWVTSIAVLLAAVIAVAVRRTHTPGT